MSEQSIIVSLYETLCGFPVKNNAMGGECHEGSCPHMSYILSSYHLIDDCHAMTGYWLQSLLDKRHDDHHYRGICLASVSRLFFALHEGGVQSDGIDKQLLLFMMCHYAQFSPLFFPVFESKPRITRLPFSFVHGHDRQGCYLIGEQTTGFLSISSSHQGGFVGHIERDEFYTPYHDRV